jgi:hypothetical protein
MLGGFWIQIAFQHISTKTPYFSTRKIPLFEINSLKILTEIFLKGALPRKKLRYAALFPPDYANLESVIACGCVALNPGSLADQKTPSFLPKGDYGGPKIEALRSSEAGLGRNGQLDWPAIDCWRVRREHPPRRSGRTDNFESPHSDGGVRIYVLIS